MTRRRQRDVSKRKQKSRHFRFLPTGACLTAGQEMVPAQAHRFGERSGHHRPRRGGDVRTLTARYTGRWRSRDRVVLTASVFLGVAAAGLRQLKRASTFGLKSKT